MEVRYNIIKLSILHFKTDTPPTFFWVINYLGMFLGFKKG